MEDKQISEVVCTIKRSSAPKGGVGYDLQVRAVEGIDKDKLTKITEDAIDIALKGKTAIESVI